MGGERLDPRGLDAGEAVEHADAVLRADDPGLGAGGADPRFALAAALPRPLIPAGCLRPAERRIGAGACEILKINAHHVARADIGLQDGGVGGVAPRSIGGDGRIGGGDARERLVEV